MGYNIYLRDANLKRIGEITDFTQLILIPMFNAVGSFQLDVPVDSTATEALIQDRAGIIVKKDGVSILSGTVSNPKRAFSVSGDTMTFIGKDDNNFLASRLAYPVPSGNFALADYDVRTGDAETVMKQYVDVNAGPSALPERRILTLEVNSGVGNSVSGSARFDKLLDLLTTLALSGGGLGFQVIQVDDQLQFQVYQPTDKTKSVYFSPLLGNVLSFDYESQAPESNFAIVGGSGEGAARVIRQRGDSESIAKYGRIESFVDQRNTSDETQLSQALDQELATKAEKDSFNFIPIDTPQLQFGRDYGLGDKVSIVVTQPNSIVTQEAIYQYISANLKEEIQPEMVQKVQQKLKVIQDIVRQVKITITPEKVTVSPLVGTSDSLAPETPKIFNQMKNLNKRISNIERS